MNPHALAALAALPIVSILALMLLARWPAARAGLAGLALAALLAPLAFGFGITRGAGRVPGSTAGDATAAVPGGLWGSLAGVAGEGAFLAATILWILWPALALHEHQQRHGALDALRSAIARVSAEPRHQLILIGWFLALFIEGAAGFGTPVALVAPILVGLGVAPVAAVTLALLGHVAGVSFGALGTPLLAQVALTQLDAAALAWQTALMHALLGGVAVFFFARTVAEVTAATPGAATDRPAARLLPWAVLAGLAFFAPFLAIAAVLGPELATLGGALVGGAIFIGTLRWLVGRASPPVAAGASTLPLPRALAPYIALVLLVLATRAVAPVAEALQQVTLRWAWNGFGAEMRPLTHPGTLLFAALLLGARLQGVGLRELARALGVAARRLLPVTVALMAMLSLSRLMLHAGMIEALETAAVQALGSAWPLLAPAVGALGSFVTGSATASNVLFTSLQAQTAASLGLPVLTLVAAQGLGAAIGNIVCPHNIVAGAATVGLAGREGEILRRMLLPCALYLALGGILVFALSRYG